VCGQTGTTGEPAPLRQPLCDLFDVSPSGCRPQGQAWAEGQVGRMMLTQGLVALPVAFGAWAAGVAFFGWRRKLALSTNAAAPRGKSGELTALRAKAAMRCATLRWDGSCGSKTARLPVPRLLRRDENPIDRDRDQNLVACLVETRINFVGRVGLEPTTGGL
jgi:hypothetical protein